jgi:peptidoglycan/xylan/chitin deacetylase (PgdA/CDA1 family)
MARRYRIAICALISAAALGLVGCGGPHAARAAWHPIRSAGAPGRGGGGDHLDETPNNGAQSTAPSSPGTTGAPGMPNATPSASDLPQSPESPAGPPSGSPSAPPNGINLSQKVTGDNTVALTFDDGPSSFTPQILAMLREHNIKATFCLVGVNVRAHHDLVQQIVREGHTLCNHTWKHDLQLGRKTPDEIRADLQATNDEIHRAVPDAPIKYFRHPGGNFTPDAIAVAKELGMASIGWDVDPRDWDTKKYPVGAGLTDHIVNVVRKHTHAGSIVLSHDAGGDRSCTMSAYRTLLPELQHEFTLAPLPT